jgi:hypothetical protein
VATLGFRLIRPRRIRPTIRGFAHAIAGFVSISKLFELLAPVTVPSVLNFNESGPYPDF